MNHPSPITQLNFADAEQSYKNIIGAGSKTFSLAARFFDRDTYSSVVRLYSWCRFCDDWIDRAHERPGASTIQAADDLLNWTEAALLGSKDVPTAFQAFAEVVRKHSIPKIYPSELIAGMHFDATNGQVRTLEDLDLYCYRVAGVVGLMMCHIMGLSRESALQAALDTGAAMQMTNIARDIKEDFALGRIYLPDVWFEIFDQKRPLFADGFSAQHFVGPVRALLLAADRRYESGLSGLNALPFFAALAVGAAQSTYREIGTLVRSRGVNAWDSRAVVPLSRKLVIIGRFLAQRGVWLNPLLHRQRQPALQLKEITPQDLPGHLTPLDWTVRL